MKAEPLSLLKLFHNLNDEQFFIPVYQRHYSWEVKHCERLWSDLMRAGKDDKINAHFMGSVVYIEDTGNAKQKSVIDGQQRLTTATLLIKALIEYLDSLSEDKVPNGFSPNKLRNYLFNPYATGDLKYKLLLSKSDKATLWSVLDNTSNTPVNTDSQRIIENYNTFKSFIEKHKEELGLICKGLEKLTIVNVSLDRSQDDPQKIFESMNSTGMALRQADLIRNFILMNLEPKTQTHLYERYWQLMEESFGTDYEVHFDAFMRHYLTAKNSEIPKINAVYDVFKKYALDKDTQTLLEEIYIYAGYYRSIVLGAKTHNELEVAFSDLAELKVDVAYPFLLDAYHHYKQDTLTSDEMLEIVRLVESYVFRRSVCDIPSHSLSTIFVDFIQIPKQNNYLEAIKSHFVSISKTTSGKLTKKRFPDNDEFQEKLKQGDLYNFKRAKYWLRRLENHNNNQPIRVGDYKDTDYYAKVNYYTVEHIMPQNPNLSKEWQDELGLNWKETQKLVHTLGNLTLTGYNREYWDYPFEFKQHKATDKQSNKISFDNTPLRLVTWEFELDIKDAQGNIEKKRFSLANVPQWNEAAIKARAEILAEKALDVWRYPKVSDNATITAQPDIDDNEDDSND